MGRSRLRSAAVVLVVAVAVMLLLAGAGAAIGEPRPGGSLDPANIQKWSQPLIIPPEMPATSPGYSRRRQAVPALILAFAPAPDHRVELRFGNHAALSTTPAFTIEAGRRAHPREIGSMAWWMQTATSCRPCTRLTRHSLGHPAWR